MHYFLKWTFLRVLKFCGISFIKQTAKARLGAHLSLDEKISFISYLSPVWLKLGFQVLKYTISSIQKSLKTGDKRIRELWPNQHLWAVTKGKRESSKAGLDCSYGHYKDVNYLQNLFQSIKQRKAKKQTTIDQIAKSLNSSSKFSLSHEILLVPCLRGQTTLKDTDWKGQFLSLNTLLSWEGPGEWGLGHS